MFRRLTLLAGGAILLMAALPVWAQNSLEGDLYGRGTHAYFSADFVKAHELLTAAVETESKDPRAYYFRGLTYLKLGRSEEARADFEKGAELENADSNAFCDVSKALERVQGKARLTIEQYRTKARLSARQRAKAVHRARYEAIRSQEDRVLRKDVVLTPEPTSEVKPVVVQAAPPAAAQPSAAAGQAEENPFAPTADNAATTAAPVPAGGAPTASGKLLGAFGKALGATLGKQVQGVTQGVGGVLPGGAMPPPKAQQPAPASDDPFGGPVPPAAAPPAKPSVATPPAAGGVEDDPFASPSPAPAVAPKSQATAPATTTPAATAPATTPSQGTPKQGGTQDNPFGAAQAPGLESPGKATAQTPVTRPATSVSPVSSAPTMAIPVSTRVTRSARPTDSVKPAAQPPTAKSEAKGSQPSQGKAAPAPQPAEDNPFREE